jgi:hypothetical protein
MVVVHCGGEWEGYCNSGLTLCVVLSVTCPYTGTIRKVQEAAIRINRRRIHALYREKKRILQANRPSLFQSEEDEKGWDKEAEKEIEKEKMVINAIQQQ